MTGRTESRNGTAAAVDTMRDCSPASQPPDQKCNAVLCTCLILIALKTAFSRVGPEEMNPFVDLTAVV